MWEYETDWKRAWHGSKIEALYSIMYHQEINSSEDAERGHRFLENKPGVYCFKDELRSKAAYYARYVPLFRDGVFWSVTWELRVDRSRRVSLQGSDQWAQPGDAVEIAALWVTGKTWRDMTNASAVQLMWDPLLEANPTQRPGGRKPAEERDDEGVAEVPPQLAQQQSQQLAPQPAQQQQQPQEVAAKAATVVIPASVSLQTSAQSSLPVHMRKITGIPVPEDWSMEDGDFNLAKGGKGGGRKSAEEKGAKGSQGGGRKLAEEKDNEGVAEVLPQQSQQLAQQQSQQLAPQPAQQQQQPEE